MYKKTRVKRGNVDDGLTSTDMSPPPPPSSSSPLLSFLILPFLLLPLLLCLPGDFLYIHRNYYHVFLGGVCALDGSLFDFFFCRFCFTFSHSSFPRNF